MKYVYIVQNDDSTRLALENLFAEKSGVESLTFKYPWEALEHLRSPNCRQYPSVVVTDLYCPDYWEQLTIARPDESPRSERIEDSEQDSKSAAVHRIREFLTPFADEGVEIVAYSHMNPEWLVGRPSSLANAARTVRLDDPLNRVFKQDRDVADLKELSAVGVLVLDRLKVELVHVFVVEDDRSTRRAVADMIRANLFDVAEVHEVKYGWELLGLIKPATPATTRETVEAAAAAFSDAANRVLVFDLMSPTYHRDAPWDIKTRLRVKKDHRLARPKILYRAVTEYLTDHLKPLLEEPNTYGVCYSYVPVALRTDFAPELAQKVVEHLESLEVRYIEKSLAAHGLLAKEMAQIGAAVSLCISATREKA